MRKVAWMEGSVFPLAGSWRMGAVGRSFLLLTKNSPPKTQGVVVFPSDARVRQK